MPPAISRSAPIGSEPNLADSLPPLEYDPVAGGPVHLVPRGRPGDELAIKARPRATDGGPVGRAPFSLDEK